MVHDSKWRRRAPYELVAASILLVTVAGLLDIPLAEWASHASTPILRLGLFVTAFGSSGYMFLLSAVVALGGLWLKSWSTRPSDKARYTLTAERAIYFFACIGASGIAAQTVKHLVGRSRPKLMHEYGAFHFEPLSAKSVLASFPSGHTTTAFSAAVALSFIAPRARPFWFAAAVLIGISRVVVGAHYPSDVVTGAALGAWMSLLVARFMAARAIAFEPGGRPLRLSPIDARGGA